MDVNQLTEVTSFVNDLQTSLVERGITLRQKLLAEVTDSKGGSAVFTVVRIDEGDDDWHLDAREV